MDVERLIERLTVIGYQLTFATQRATVEEAAAALAKLQAERDEALRQMAVYAREAGLATGKLETSEAAGIVEGWKERAEKAEAERDEAQAALEVCRESLVDQAAARADPAMPLLVASVRERLEGESEAVYAMSESREDRIYAHGLSLLCDWQKAAASRALGGGE